MRLPIRVRLTAWYIAVLAAIIGVLGPFVVLQFRSDMQAGIDRDARRAWVALAHEYADEGLQHYGDYGRTFLPRDGAAQVFDSGGRLLASWGDDMDEGGILAPAGPRADALAGKARLATVSLGEDGEKYRVRIAPVERLGERHVLAVAESLQPVEASVARVLTLLLLTVPAALVAASIAGWWLARKALLPVRRMTSKADHIGIDRLDERIAVPHARDELAHLAVTLNAMLDRLEQGVAEQQRFVAHASHELRTPLAVMRAELDVNLRGDLPESGRGVLESAREEVDRMSRTVENLMTLAHADEGQLQLLTTQVDLTDAADAAIRSLAPAAANNGIDLHAEDVTGDPPICRGRPAPRAPGARQPHRERDQVHRSGRRGAGARLAAGRSRGGDGVRHRPRHPARGPRPRLRPLLPRRPGAAADERRQRARPRDLPRDRRGPRRAGVGRERGRQRQRVLARTGGGAAVSDAYRVRRGAGLKTGGDKVTLRDS